MRFHQEDDGDSDEDNQDGVKMNTQRDVKITIVNIDSVDSTP